MINYARVNKKDWEKIQNLPCPPNVKGILANLQAYGPNAIVPAAEIMSCFSGIGQANQTFIKNKVRYRLRIVQSGYPRGCLYGFRGYPKGYLVQLARRKSEVAGS